MTLGNDDAEMPVITGSSVKDTCGACPIGLPLVSFMGDHACTWTRPSP